MLQITSEPIGRGRERACYVHPEDPAKAIKIAHGDTNKQSRREIAFYRDLERRGLEYVEHVPRFYGLCTTDRGDGIVVELIRDFDGAVSRPLNTYLANGYPIEEFEPYLDALHRSLRRNLILFNHDLHIGNLLFQKRAPGDARLVAIDGLGDVVAIDWLDRIAPLRRRKIERRWQRLQARLYRSAEVRAQRAAAAPGRTLKPDY